MEAFSKSLPVPIGRGDRFIVAEDALVKRLIASDADLIRSRSNSKLRQFEFLVLGFYPDKNFRKPYVMLLMNPELILSKRGQADFLEYLDANYVHLMIGDFESTIHDMGCRTQSEVDASFMASLNFLWLTAVSQALL